jgi:tRNA threonylcarbamoyladenosine biosynthesis protein TsaE
MPLKNKSIISHSVKDTLAIGEKIARKLVKGDVVCLFGQLGSGKTVLTKGIASGLGVEKNKIISPTFVLIRQHLKGRLPLYHFDLYRLSATKDIMVLGYEEYIYGEGVSVIEWADRLKYLLPKEYLGIDLTIQGQLKRAFKFSACGERYKELLVSLTKSML